MFVRDPQRVDFYKSKAWKSTRDAYMESQHHVCERCGRPAKIVHHRRYLDGDNVNDLEGTALNWDNLEALCQECHNREHFGVSPTATGLHFDRYGNLVAD